MNKLLIQKLTRTALYFIATLFTISANALTESDYVTCDNAIRAVESSNNNITNKFLNSSLQQSYERADEWFKGKFGNYYTNTFNDEYKLQSGKNLSNEGIQALITDVYSESFLRCKYLVESGENPHEKVWQVMGTYMGIVYSRKR